MLLALAVSPVLCAFGAVQVLGVATVGYARLAEGTRHERIGQWACFAAILLVGTLCGAAIPFGPDTAAACAATLALMTLLAVADFSPRG